MKDTIDLVAIETAVKAGEDTDAAIVAALGYHGGKAGGVPPFLVGEVKKIRRRLAERARKAPAKRKAPAVVDQAAEAPAKRKAPAARKSRAKVKKG